MKDNHFIQPFIFALSRTRDPDLKFIHHFKGFGIHKSKCQVEIWFESMRAICMFSDMGNDGGTSITNDAERIISEVYNKHLSHYLRENVLFCETYDKQEGISIILPDWNGPFVKSVEWMYLGKIIKQKENE